MKTPKIPENVVLLSALLGSIGFNAPGQTTNSPRTPATGIVTNAATPSQPQKKEMLIPAGSVNFVNVNVSQFLQIYGAYTGAQVDTNRLGARLFVLIHFTNTNAVTRSELIRLFDQVLYEQAGIEATHPDKTHVILELRSQKKGK